MTCGHLKIEVDWKKCFAWFYESIRSVACTACEEVIHSKAAIHESVRGNSQKLLLTQDLTKNERGLNRADKASAGIKTNNVSAAENGLLHGNREFLPWVSLCVPCLCS